MKSKGPFVLITLFVLILLVTVARSDAAVTCSDVAKGLRPCLTHLRGSGTALPSAACCAGLKSMASSVSTADDKTAICGCVRSAFRKIKVTDATAKALPGRCSWPLWR